MPPPILHKVQKGETVSGLAKKYKVEEHKIVQANPDTVKMVKNGNRHEPFIYEGTIVKIPQGSDGASVFIIKGNQTIGMGKSEEYELLTEEEKPVQYPPEKIKWIFSVDEGGDNWRKLRSEKEKLGQKISLVFTNQKLKAKKILIEAFLKQENAEAKKLAELNAGLTGEDKPEISKVDLLDINRNILKRTISYSETVFARAQCTGMEGETLYFSLWEDDAPGAGHSPENEENLILTKEAKVMNGLAETAFRMRADTMVPIANRKISQGQRDEGQFHEYYVTVSRHGESEVEQSSQNMNVNNPDYKPPIPRPKPKSAPAPKPKPQPKKKEEPQPQIIHRDKVNNYPKPSASAWKEAKIIQIYFGDVKGNKLEQAPKPGDRVLVYIESENLVGKRVNLKLYDIAHKESLLFNEDKILTSRMNYVEVITYMAIPFETLYAEVAVYETKQTVKTNIFVVDKNNHSYPVPEGISPTKVLTKAPEREEKKGECSNCKKNFEWGEIKDIFGDSDKDFRMKCVEWINDYKLMFGIDTCAKKAHFLAQIAAETHFREKEMAEGSVKYTPKNIRSGTFGDRAKILEKRGKIEEYCSERPEQVKLFNFLYASEYKFGNGNGNEASGDGYRFRGKGLIQLTGKGNYKTAMALMYENIPKDTYITLLKSETRKKTYPEFSSYDGAKTKTIKNVELFNFLDYSDMPLEPKYSVLSAFADWKGKGLSNSPLMTNNLANVRPIRVKINGWISNLKVAEEYFTKAVKVLLVDQCKAVAQPKKEEPKPNGKCLADGSQCYEYADVWDNPEISDDNKGKNNNRYDHGSARGHKGVDILSGSTYKDVHSIMCGVVEATVTSFKTNEYGYLKLGNVVNIKSKDKNGKTVYILYCHLDKVYVQKGDKVKHGQKIALSGSTGNASDESLPNGKPGKGIKKENWHVHIEACSDGAGLVTFYLKDRLQPEDYMKTKFDKNGNVTK